MLRGRHRQRLLVHARRSLDVQDVIRDWLAEIYWSSRVRVSVGDVAPAPSPISQATPPPPPDVFRNCLGCHNDDVIRQQRLTRPQWSAEINKMAGWGARVDDAGRQALLDYLDKLR